jgi:hypothetical protein
LSGVRSTTYSAVVREGRIIARPNSGITATTNCRDHPIIYDRPPVRPATRAGQGFFGCLNYGAISNLDPSAVRGTAEHYGFTPDVRCKHC